MNDPLTPRPVPHPFAELLGFEVSTQEAGRSLATLTSGDAHLNPHGIVHGAVLYALADTGMGAALTQALEPEELCSTIEIKINYFRPALPGPLRCETRLIHRGRRTGALESEVFNEAGKLLARATGTFMILRQD